MYTFALFCAVSASLAYPNDDITLVTFNGDKNTRPWHATNDPVMGGRSESTVTVDQAKGLAEWKGEVKTVPFLRAPGFCHIDTVGPMPFPSVTGTAGLKFTLSSTTDTQLTAFQFQLETKGGKDSNGRQGTYEANATLPADGQDHTLFASWKEFVFTWRGEKIHGPDITSQLDQIISVGITTAFPGKDGTFDLSLKQISAGVI